VLPNPEPQPVATVELPSLPDEPDTAVLPFELASPVEATPRPIDVVPLQTACWSWATVLLTIWLSGAALTLLVICSRLLHLWGTLSRAGSGPDAELAAHVETLRKRLKLRRRVRVWVTPTDHGPAVLGLIRPWLLLPKTLVESVAPDDLEPLLAHELLHIRRGDLWIGWWQAVVQAAWWLHPLVWWSNRVLTRQLERCCDEEVLAELGCEPARYARGLLKALELKHRLRPVPAAPGVRPVDLTAERMERIMRMGQGSRRRTPWWCWAIMAIGLLVTLPGAGLKLGAEEPGKVLFGVGVNSEAGVTGTVILGEDDATPADAQEPATVISGERF
jgi:beta-lactamase regulating signal transducer with metallopeptidase domain